MTSSAQKFHTVDELKLLVAPVAKKYGVAKVYTFSDLWQEEITERTAIMTSA